MQIRRYSSQSSSATLTARKLSQVRSWKAVCRCISVIQEPVRNPDSRSRVLLNYRRGRYRVWFCREINPDANQTGYVSQFFKMGYLAHKIGIKERWQNVFTGMPTTKTICDRSWVPSSDRHFFLDEVAPVLCAGLHACTKRGRNSGLCVQEPPALRDLHYRRSGFRERSNRGRRAMSEDEGQGPVVSGT